MDLIFDKLQVIHNRGQMLEENHYYPFGLVMAGISGKAANFGLPENKKKFNDGTELNTDFDINFYETEFRSYDPQIGRFGQIDPLGEATDGWSSFSFVQNNPILFNDPLGLSGDTTTLPTVVVVGLKKDCKTCSPPSTGSSSSNIIAPPIPVTPPSPPPPTFTPAPSEAPSPIKPTGTKGSPTRFPPITLGISFGTKAFGLTAGALLWSNDLGAGSSRIPEFFTNPNSNPYVGHANNRNNSNPHIVYQITFTPQDARTPILKYGISDAYRYGMNRPVNQMAGFIAKYGTTVTMKILTRANNRTEALLIERQLVTDHVIIYKELPREQTRPSPNLPF